MASLTIFYGLLMMVIQWVGASALDHLQERQGQGREEMEKMVGLVRSVAIKLNLVIVGFGALLWVISPFLAERIAPDQ